MNKINRWLTGVVFALLTSLLIPTTALPCGPGVHIRESDSIWPALVEQYPNLADLRDTPMFETYLHLGAILPDFQWFLPVQQGHSSEFSLYLISKAIDEEPRFLVTALGHLMHNSVSDPLCEQFWTPTLLASAPLGMVYLLEGYSNARGMSEGITEVLGDLLVGDWDALIDMVFDIFLEDENAEARGHEMIVWYVEHMNDYYASETDPEMVWQSLQDKVADYSMYISGLDRAMAKDMFHEMKGDTPAEAISLFTGDLVSKLAGDAAKRCEDFDTNIATVMKSALVEQWFWDVYADTLLSGLSSFWYLDRVAPFAGTMLAEDVSAAVLGWPTWGGNPMISGNVMSAMQFHDDIYDVVPGLIVDDVVWMDEAGNAISRFTTDMMSQTLKVRVRYYTALDFSGEIRLVVKTDLPGLDQSSDEIVGQHTETVTLDPRGYVLGTRNTIEAEFQPVLSTIDGFYLELYALDNEGPWFTTNWDTMMAGGRIPVYQKIYRDNFATYGKWPPSLPVSPDQRPEDCEFYVTARTFGGGGPIPGTRITLASQGASIPGHEPYTQDASANGMVVFDHLSPGTYNITSTAPNGYVNPVLDPTVLECAPAITGQVWVNQEFHTIPKAWVEGGVSGRNDCIVFQTNSIDFWGRAEKFQVTVTDANDDQVVLLPMVEKSPRPKIEACFPTPVENGASVTIHLLPRYINDLGMGVEGISTPILIDSTLPVIDGIELLELNDECAGDSGVHPFNAVLSVTSQSSGVQEVEYSSDGTNWQAIEFESVTVEGGVFDLTTSFSPEMTSGMVVGQDVWFRIRNTLGIDSEAVAARIPQELACATVPVETDPTDVIVTPDEGLRDDVLESDVPAADTVMTDDGNPLPDQDVDEGGGCSAGGNGAGSSWIVLLCLAMAGMLMYRRRGNHAGRDF